ncbi:MAG: 50S ribosomal protein L35 [Fusobacteria bacterium]|nr:50S ribosomal protein L35 [Fusobacteriota bacterium]
MPKMKTHSGAKKRIKITGTGKYVVKPTGKSHILTKKSRARKNRLNLDHTIDPGKIKMISKLLANKVGR